MRPGESFDTDRKSQCRLALCCPGQFRSVDSDLLRPLLEILAMVVPSGSTGMPTTIANKCARNFMSLRSLFWTYLISFSVCTFQPVHTCEFPYALSAWSSVSLQSFLKSLFPRLLERASWAKLPWGHFFARFQSPIPVLLDNVLAGIPHWCVTAMPTPRTIRGFEASFDDVPVFHFTAMSVTHRIFRREQWTINITEPRSSAW